MNQSQSTQRSESDKCVIWGGYGGGNVGDFLTLAIGLATCQKHYGNNINILTYSTEELQTQFPDQSLVLMTGRMAYLNRIKSPITRLIHEIRRQVVLSAASFSKFLPKPLRNPVLTVLGVPAWVKTIGESELFYMVGGGYINDLFEQERYLFPLRLALAFNIPVKTAALGLGPFTDPVIEADVANLLRKTRLAVRDKDSYAWAQRHGIACELTQDAGFQLLEAMPELAVPAKPSTSARKFILGIDIFMQFGLQKNEALQTWWMTFLKALKPYEHLIELEGFCFDSRESFDYQTMVTLFEATGWDPANVHRPSADFRDAMRLVTRFDAVISCRFHGVVVSRVYGVPCFAFALGQYYISKMQSLASDEGQCWLVAAERDTPEQIIERILILSTERDPQLVVQSAV